MKQLFLALLISASCCLPGYCGILSSIKAGVHKLGVCTIQEIRNLPTELVQGVVAVKVVPTVAGLVTLKVVKLANDDREHPRNIYVTITGTSGKVVNYIITLLKPIPMAILDAVLVLKLLPLALWLL